MKKLVYFLIFGLNWTGGAIAQEYTCGHTDEGVVQTKEQAFCNNLPNYKLDKTSGYQYSPVYRPNVQIHVFQYSASDPRNFTTADMVDLQQIMDWINGIFMNIQPPTRPVLPPGDEETDSRIELNFLPVDFIVDPVAWDRNTTNQSLPQTIVGFPSLSQVDIAGALPFTPTCIQVSGSPSNDGSYKVLSAIYDGTCSCTHVTINGTFASTSGTGSVVLLQPASDLNCSWDIFNTYHASSLNTIHVYFTSYSNSCIAGFGCGPSPYWCNVSTHYPFNPAGYYALAQLTAHEIGHCLGLPHTADDNNGCHPNTWNSAYGITDLPTTDCMGWLTCNSTNTSNNVMGYNTCRNYFSPLQIARMRYNLSTDIYRINYLKECDYDAAETVTINGNVTWNNREVVGGDIIIPAGSTLTIQCRVNMPEGSVIKVYPGGKLVVDGGTLTNLCGEWWQGIEAIGNPSNHIQNGTNQATVIVKNGALIENAYVAIRGGEVDPTYVTQFNQGGAIVQVSNSTFRNNWWGVQMTPYDRQTSVGTSINNASYIRESWFINDAPLTNPAHTEPTSCISIWDARGIQIRGNTFESSRTDLGGKENLQGVGITLIDAHNTVITSQCNSMTYPCPAGSLVPNQFINLYMGVQSLLGEGTDNITITNNRFENCVYGIKSSGSSYPNVALNTFEIPFATNALWPGSILYSDAFGIYFDGNYSYNIEENTFIPFQNGGSGQSVGIMVNNSSSATSGSKIYRNDFGDITQSVSTRGLTLGIQAQGNNSTLPIDCNRFYEGDMTSKIDIHWASGTLANQGACSTTDPLLPQANEFYGTSCSMSALNAQIWRNVGTSGNPIYHSYSTVGYNDGCNNWGTFSMDCSLAGEPSYSYNVACPSNLGIIKSPVVTESVTLSRLELVMAGLDELIVNGDEAERSYYRAQKYDLMASVISGYLDSGNVAAALNVLALDKSSEARSAMVPVLVEYGLYEEAKSVINIVYDTALVRYAADPENQETIDLLNFCRFYMVLEGIAGNPAGYFALNAAGLEELRQIAESGSPIGANARAVLYFVNSERPYSPAYPVNGHAVEESDPNKANPASIRCFPNPNQGSFNVEIKTAVEQENGVISIYDPVGHRVWSSALQGSNAGTMLTVDGLASGIYQVVYFVNDEILATEKLVILE